MKKTNLSLLILILVGMNAAMLFASEEQQGDAIEVVAEYAYKIHTQESEDKYKPLCLFDAKYKAVALAAKYLAHDGLLPDYGKKQKEIFCLTAEGIGVSIIDKALDAPANTYSVKIKAVIQVTDFIRAEIKNNEFEALEKNFSLKEEMELHVYTAIVPGEELSRAYRYLRQRHWRIALIYLTHLEKKYPNWDKIYFAKAIGFYAINNKAAMMTALDTSCALGNTEACEDAKGFLSGDENIKVFKKRD